MRTLHIFPLLAIPVVIYNLIAWGGTAFGAPGENPGERFMLEQFSINLPTDGQWNITSGDILVFMALILLFVEMLKSTDTGRETIINHSLSMVLFIVCLIEFLLAPSFATTVFFLIMVMTLLDVLGGIIVTIMTSRRDVSVEG